MSLLGIHVTLLIGPAVPVPAPPPLLEAMKSIEVRHGDDGPSTFQITFHVGRSGPLDLLDYGLLSNPLLKTFNRVIVIVTFGVLPRVLMDGFITNQELSPSNEPGASTLTVTGEDCCVMMDLEERSAEHPAQDETIIANKIILTYAQFGLIPMVIPPLAIDPPIPVERVPVQQSSDMGFLCEMAARHGYVFYVTPGPAPFMNTAYWGPPVRIGFPQKALSVNMGPQTNVQNISFRNNALGPALVEGQVQDRITNQTVPVQTVAPLRIPLSAMPASLTNLPNVRRRKFRASGLNAMQAYGRAQGETDASNDDVVKVTGELDALQYGDFLQSRALVGLRGVGYSYDGFYYVKDVTHLIALGSYTQNFTLTREGLGSLTPVLPT
jgi:hypothetical protein